MAANESKIRFKLTSDYDGKGFQQVNSDLSKTAKNVSKAAGGVEKFGQAASAIPGKFGAIASSATGLVGVVKNLMQGLGNLGPIGLAAAAIGSLFAGIKIGMDKAEKRVEEAKEKIARHAEAMKTAIASRLNWLRQKMDSDFDAMKEGVKSAISSFDKLIQRINKVNGAKAEVTVAEAEGRAALRANSKTSQLIGINDDSERALLEARLNEKEALEEREEIIRKNAENEKEADKNLKNAQDRRKVLDENIATIKQALADAEADAAAAAKTGTKDTKQFDDRIKRIRQELEKAQEDLKDQDVEIATLEEKRKATIIRNENALIENETKILQLNDSTQRLIAAQEKAARAEERQAQIASLRKQGSDLQDQANNKIKDVDGKIANAMNNIKAIEDAQARTRAGMVKDQEKHRGISGRGFQYEVDANGSPANLAGWERAQRYAARGDRDAQRANRAAAANEREYNKLRDKLENGESLSDSEMKRYDKLDAWNKERKGKEKEQEKIKTLEDTKKQIMEDTKTAVESIKTKIEQLGLK